jgi:hypothetical protein
MRENSHPTKWLAVIALMVSTSAWAQGQPASEASIREYLAVTKARELVDGSYAQVHQMMRDAMRSAAPNGFNEAQTRIMEDMSTRIVAILQDEMGWEKLEQDFIEIYRATLTQDEVDGMVAFYKSDAGRALTAKMPAIMEKTMGLMTQRLQVMRPRMLELQKDAIARMEQAGK